MLHVHALHRCTAIPKKVDADLMFAVSGFLMEESVKDPDL